MTIIYTLKDPFNNEIKYVGKTKSSIKHRLNQHCCKQNLKNKSHTINWIKSLLKKNAKPIIEELDEVNDENWETEEKYWIEQLIQWGFKLTNTTKGGETGCLGYKHTISAKRRISILNSRPKSQEWIDNTARASRKAKARRTIQKDLNGKCIKVWDSASVAANFLGDPTRSKLKNIVACCRGKRKSAYGYMWEYEIIEE
jgi:hypothetical protein